MSDIQFWYGSAILRCRDLRARQIAKPLAKYCHLIIKKRRIKLSNLADDEMCLLLFVVNIFFLGGASC